MIYNVKLNYLYRDADNFKWWGEVVFENHSMLDLEELRARLGRLLDFEILFIADQIRIPELFPYNTEPPTESDHCFHELDRLDSTDEEPDDWHHRSIEEFIAEFEREARRGWRVFDPFTRT